MRLSLFAGAKLQNKPRFDRFYGLAHFSRHPLARGVILAIHDGAQSLAMFLEPLPKPDLCRSGLHSCLHCTLDSSRKVLSMTLTGCLDRLSLIVPRMLSPPARVRLDHLFLQLAEKPPRLRRAEPFQYLDPTAAVGGSPGLSALPFSFSNNSCAPAASLRLERLSSIAFFSGPSVKRPRLAQFFARFLAP